jgi:hypothetical protein
MATRFYLPSSGTAPLSALGVASTWEQTTGLQRFPCSTTKRNTALTDSTRTWASNSTQQWAWYQYQSWPLETGYTWTTADTVSLVIRGLEANAQCDDYIAYSVRVVSIDGVTERGIVGWKGSTTGATEFTTSAETRICDALNGGAADFISYPRDRIIIEIGLHGVTPSTSYTQTLRVGDPSATNDFALTSALTTDLCPWVELSRTVTINEAIMTPWLKVA